VTLVLILAKAMKTSHRIQAQLEVKGRLQGIFLDAFVPSQTIKSRPSYGLCFEGGYNVKINDGISFR
jgi:hypothetical protein